jgi:muconate cycloisomerase
MAAYDLAAVQLGVPVHSLLGGAARTRIPITHSIGFIPLDDAEKEAIQVVAEGIRTIKIKVGVDPERDVAVVKRVRDAIGSSVEICIDANQGYATPGQAIQTYRRIESCCIKYFEQPVHGVDRIAQVARAIDSPVMADESAWNAHDVFEIAEKRAAQIVSIYTTKPGGLYRAMQVAAVCSAAGIVCNVNGSIETGVGNLANLQLAAAAEAVTLSCVIPISTPAEAQRGQIAGIYYRDDLLVEPMVLHDGALTLPTGVGMGMKVDENKIKQFTVGK